jgi:hypothetical protein
MVSELTVCDMRARSDANLDVSQDRRLLLPERVSVAE